MGRLSVSLVLSNPLIKFPIIPPQVNGATGVRFYQFFQDMEFPIIPPQVNGATDVLLSG
jgi:hypothetical protein